MKTHVIGSTGEEVDKREQSYDISENTSWDSYTMDDSVDISMKRIVN